MASTQFLIENHFPSQIFDVQATCDILESPISTGQTNQTNIIHVGDQAIIKVDWTQTGLASNVGLFNANCHYHLNVFLEKMGPGEGPNVPSPPLVLLQQGPPAGPINYTQSINLPALGVGIYKVVVTMNFVVPGHVANFLHGFHEAGLIQVVTP